MSFKIAVLGAGTYGSYLANALVEKYPFADIHLFDVGNEKIKSEQQIGFLSHTKGGYRATTKGRFFGLGGTSAMWGGQLLFFSKKDFSNDDHMREIVDCNILFRNKVLSRFFAKVPVLDEKSVSEYLSVKQGIWLNFQRRNLYKFFRLSHRKNITVHKNCRVTRLISEDGRISAISLNEDQKESEFKADFFYLTCGAFESIRLLHVSNILDMEESSFGFSDHISLRCFKLDSSVAKILSHDFIFRFNEGAMITSRLVGEMDDVSYYIHPIFNEDFAFFQFMKELIFKRKFSFEKFKAIGRQALLIVPFLYNYFINKKLYLCGPWYINLDIELSRSNNSVLLSKELDKYGQNGIVVKYNISTDTLEKLLIVKENVKKILRKSNLEFKEMVSNSLTAIKPEDSYHPYGFFSYTGDKSILDLYNPVSNLFLFNTGLLYRSGNINPTASLFCLIEYHIDRLDHLHQKVAKKSTNMVAEMD
jgi:hypothetical protein